MRLSTIHGNMNQTQRDSVFKSLRSGAIQILVATDVVGRGIDVTTISHIINYDLPDEVDDYVHRVGRTGRMGRDGIAFTFIFKGQGDLLTEIEQRINRLLIADPLAQDFGITKKVSIPLSMQDSDDASTPESAPSVDVKKRSLNPMRRKISARSKRRR